MSSYLSQPRQYNAYVPEINSEMYGKLLEQKKEAYDKGVQKIENTITQVASLPVYRQQDKEHLQKLVDGVTTELNQQHGADWSDHHLNNITSKHIATIANDEGVQSAVSSTLQAKSAMQKRKDDMDANGGKPLANEFVFNQHFNKWLQDPKVGAKFSADYTLYSDNDADADAGILKIPTDKINKSTWGIKPKLDRHGNPVIGPDGKPEMVQDITKDTLHSQEIEIRDPIKIHQYLTNFLTQGNYAEQARINAQYEYKGMSPQEFIRKKYSDIHPELINTNNKEIDYLKEELLKRGNISDPVVMAERGAIEQEIKKRQNSNSDIEQSMQNAEKDYLDYHDEDKRVGLQTDLYTKEWMNSKIKTYSLRKEGKIEIQGQTGFQMQRELQASQLAERKFKADEDERIYQHERDDIKDRLERQKAIAKQKGIDPETGKGIISPGVNTESAKNSYNVVRQNIDKTDRSIQDLQNEVLYTSLLESSPKDAHDLFEVGDHGQVIRKGNLSADANKMLDTAIAGLEQSKKDGAYWVRDKKVTLSEASLPIIQKITDLKNLQDDKREGVKEVEDKVFKESGLLNIVSELNAKPLIINNPLDWATSNAKTKITGEDIKTYGTLPDDIKEDIDRLYSVLPGVNLHSWFAGDGDGMALAYKLKKYNLSLDQVYTLFKSDDVIGKGALGILGGPLSGNDPEYMRGATLVNKANDIMGKRYSDMLDKELESRNLIYTPNLIPWGEGDANDRVLSAQRARRIAGTLGEKGKEFIKVLDGKGEPEFHYTADAATGDIQLVVGNGKDMAVIDIDKRNAKSYGFSDLAPEDSYLSQRLMWNKDGGTIPRGQTASHENAITLGTFKGSDNVTRELRYHIVPKYGAYWMYSYTIDPKLNPKDGVQFKMEQLPSNDPNDINNAIIAAEDRIQQLNKRK